VGNVVRDLLHPSVFTILAIDKRAHFDAKGLLLLVDLVRLTLRPGS
jgi:hypothetical protein